MVASSVCRRGKSPQKAFNLNPTTVGNTDLNQKKKSFSTSVREERKKILEGEENSDLNPEERGEKRKKKKKRWLGEYVHVREERGKKKKREQREERIKNYYLILQHATVL